MSMINADENFEKLGLTCIFPVTGLCGMISP